VSEVFAEIDALNCESIDAIVPSVAFIAVTCAGVSWLVFMLVPAFVWSIAGMAVVPLSPAGIAPACISRFAS
jgi:hypothetical protein